MTPSALILSLIAGFAFIAAVNVQSGWLFLVADALIALIFASLILGTLRLRGITLRVHPVGTAEAGKTALLSVTLEHPGRERPLILCMVPPLGKKPRRRWLYTRLVPWEWPYEVVSRLGTPHTLTLELDTPMRGEYSLPPVVLASSPLGYWVTMRPHPTEQKVLVLPRIVRLLALPWLRYARGEHLGPPQTKPGGELFRSLRDYRVGDSLRQVHWKSSAKRGTLMIKETETEEAMHQVHLVLDPSGDDEVVEQVFSVAASILNHLETRGLRATLESACGIAPDGYEAQLEWLARHPALTQAAPIRPDAILIAGTGEKNGAFVLNCGNGSGGNLQCPPGCDLARVLGATT